MIVLASSANADALDPARKLSQYQLLTLYTTPVVYLYLARARLWSAAFWQRRLHRFGQGAFGSVVARHRRPLAN